MGNHEHDYIAEMEDIQADPKTARHCGCLGHLNGKPERHTAVRVGPRRSTAVTAFGQLLHDIGPGNPFKRVSR